MVSKTSNQNGRSGALLCKEEAVPICDHHVITVLVGMLRRAAHESVDNEGVLTFSEPSKLLADILAGNGVVVTRWSGTGFDSYRKPEAYHYNAARKILACVGCPTESWFD